MEFMQGNTPGIALVLEEQAGRLRLYTQNHREMTLGASRLLPWAGPACGTNLSRAAMDAVLEERNAARVAFGAEINLPELWELVQGETEKASPTWLAALVWAKPTIDQEAALGRSLLADKIHFRFAPPDFEIASQELAASRLAEQEAQRLKEAVLGAGSDFFRILWDIHCRRRGKLQPKELPQPELADRLRSLLFARIAEQETPDTEQLWKNLVKGLPETSFQALFLATAWGLVPEHYNFMLDRAGYERGGDWVRHFAQDCKSLVAQLEESKASFPEIFLPFISIDPASTYDRDDAIHVAVGADGSFQVHVALACPAVGWPFGSPLDKALLRRASSIYLPEGDEHMLPAEIGWKLFSMDAGASRPSLVVRLELSSTGEILSVEPCFANVVIAANLTLTDAEAALAELDSESVQDSSSPASDEKQGGESSFREGLAEIEALFAACEPESCRQVQPSLPRCKSTDAHMSLLSDAYTLARVLQQRRIASGAVITERPDPDIVLEGQGEQTTVNIAMPSPCYRAHLVVGECMVLVNAALAQWSRERNIPMLYRTQDVALPREFSGVWSQPHEISRAVRALPPACLETQAKRHAGLGLPAYTTVTSPLRRYIDLVNQGQCVHYLRSGAPRLNQEELQALLPFITASTDAVTHVQRMRPRYWKFVFFRQQGDKQWWDAVVTEEHEAFVSIALPWAQMMLRGRRSLFNDKVHAGQRLQVRLGKVAPLLQEMQILETREDS